MHVCWCVGVHAWMFCAYVWKRLCMYVCVHMNAHVCVCVCVCAWCVCVCVCASWCVCMCIRYVHICVHINDAMKSNLSCCFMYVNVQERNDG